MYKSLRTVKNKNFSTFLERNPAISLSTHRIENKSTSHETKCIESRKNSFKVKDKVCTKTKQTPLSVFSFKLSVLRLYWCKYLSFVL